MLERGGDSYQQIPHGGPFRRPNADQFGPPDELSGIRTCRCNAIDSTGQPLLSLLALLA